MNLELDINYELSDEKESVLEYSFENEAEMQEMNELLQYALEQSDEAVQLTEGEFDEQGRFTHGNVEGIDSEAAEFDPELQELTKELDTWVEQGEQMSCAVASQTMAINQLSSETYTEQEFIDVARENGWYNNGTCAKDVGKIAEYMGMDVEQFHGVPASELELANNPEVKVLANVDSTLLQYPDSFKRCQPNHCVQVLRVESTCNGEMVILNDPGHQGGRGAVYPMKIFEKAYNGDITTIRKAAMA